MIIILHFYNKKSQDSKISLHVEHKPRMYNVYSRFFKQERITTCTSSYRCSYVLHYKYNMINNGHSEAVVVENHFLKTMSSTCRLRQYRDTFPSSKDQRCTYSSTTGRKILSCCFSKINEFTKIMSINVNKNIHILYINQFRQHSKVPTSHDLGFIHLFRINKHCYCAIFTGIIFNSIQV
jgi:hypothetical protein